MWDRQIDSLEVSYATLMTALEDGFEEGFEKGREEERLQFTQQLMDSARNFLKSGFPADVIAENLNLPLERVLQLQSELNTNS
ncbi:TPA: hypothetical protein ACGO2X_001188 [Streptococcus suis]